MFMLRDREFQSHNYDLNYAAASPARETYSVKTLDTSVDQIWVRMSICKVIWL